MKKVNREVKLNSIHGLSSPEFQIVWGDSVLWVWNWSICREKHCCFIVSIRVFSNSYTQNYSRAKKHGMESCVCVYSAFGIPHQIRSHTLCPVFKHMWSNVSSDWVKYRKSPWLLWPVNYSPQNSHKPQNNFAWPQKLGLFFFIYTT